MNIGQRKITLKSNTESILDHYLNFCFRLELAWTTCKANAWNVSNAIKLLPCSFGMLEEKDVSSH